MVESQRKGLHMVRDGLDTLALTRAVSLLLSNCGVEEGEHSGSGIKLLGGVGLGRVGLGLRT